MEGRPPEVTDAVNGEVLKLACMACIRGHRTKHCGSHACRDKILWTIKRPGRPSNSCMCKFSGTGRCKCVIAKAQCPHKAKRGEKKTVDCRCDERGRLCCTLDSDQWQTVAKDGKPTVRLYRNQEELHANLPARPMRPAFTGADVLPPGQSPMSTPQTPAASMSGFTNGSGRSTPQTPMSLMMPTNPFNVAQPQSVPQSPGYPSARFGMMGIGAPMGSEGHVGQDVLSWQGQTPIAPTPRQTFPLPPHGHPRMQMQMSSPFPPQVDHSGQTIQVPYALDNSIHQPPMFSPLHQEAHPAAHSPAPMLPPQHPASPSYDAMPPVTHSFGGLSMAPAETLAARNAFDTDYFNFQFPGAICQQCGMANCTCRSCPTVLQSTMDGSWKQCCSRKHVFDTPVGAGPQTAQPASGGCCGSKPKSLSLATARHPMTATASAVSAVNINATQEGGFGLQHQTIMDDPFDFDAAPTMNAFDTFSMDSQSASPGPQGSIFSPPGQGASMQAPTFNTGAPFSHAQHQSQPHIQPHNHPPISANGGYVPLPAPAEAATPQQQAPYFAANEPGIVDPDYDFMQNPVLDIPDLDDTDMDFDQFIQEQGVCGCRDNCPCVLDDSPDMDLDGSQEDSPAGHQTDVQPQVGGCCNRGQVDDSWPLCTDAEE